jgi:hypothetical protein
LMFTLGNFTRKSLTTIPKSTPRGAKNSSLVVAAT